MTDSHPLLTQLRLTRGDEGTFGVLLREDGSTVCVIGELPWKDNERDVSCIPSTQRNGGKLYHAFVRDSPKNGRCFELTSVPGRTHVQLHVANWVGDAALGLRCQVLGCMAVGRRRKVIGDQMAVSSSRKTLDKMLAEFPHGFRLRIIEAWT